MYCSQCGTQISDSSVFCHQCGAKMYGKSLMEEVGIGQPRVAYAAATAPVCVGGETRRDGGSASPMTAPPQVATETRATFCHNCGSQATREGSFCSGCGASLLSDAQYPPGGATMRESAPGLRQPNVFPDTRTPLVCRDAPVPPKLGWQIGGSILSSLIALLFFPVIFGAIGAILGGYVFVKGQKTTGVALIVAGVAVAIIGMVFAAIALSSTG